jgi:hypothetical protein
MPIQTLFGELDSTTGSVVEEIVLPPGPMEPSLPRNLTEEDDSAPLVERSGSAEFTRDDLLQQLAEEADREDRARFVHEFGLADALADGTERDDPISEDGNLENLHHSILERPQQQLHFADFSLDEMSVGITFREFVEAYNAVCFANHYGVVLNVSLDVTWTHLGFIDDYKAIRDHIFDGRT